MHFKLRIFQTTRNYPSGFIGYSYFGSEGADHNLIYNHTVLKWRNWMCIFDM